MADHGRVRQHIVCVLYINASVKHMHDYHLYYYARVHNANSVVLQVSVYRLHYVI